MKKIKLSPPWITYVHELEKMFENDPDVSIRYNDEDKIVSIYATSCDKSAALTRILKDEVTFGKITLKIEVIEPNKNENDILDVFNDAFVGNPALEYAVPIESPFGTCRYAVFKNEVVQFYNDQIDDIHGNKSTLYQDIARDIFKDDLAINYCTETNDKNLGKPLGEWP